VHTGQGVPAGKHQEAVFCAGITASGQLRRLYPVVYRKLQSEQRFDRFDWIEANVNRSAFDSRPACYEARRESHRSISPCGFGKRKDPTHDPRHIRRAPSSDRQSPCQVISHRIHAGKSKGYTDAVQACRRSAADEHHFWE
jgi:hypothetical protein